MFEFDAESTVRSCAVHVGNTFSLKSAAFCFFCNCQFWAFFLKKKCSDNHSYSSFIRADDVICQAKGQNVQFLARPPEAGWKNESVSVDESLQQKSPPANFPVHNDWTGSEI